MKNKLLRVLLTTSIANMTLFSYDSFVTQTTNVRELPSLESRVVGVVDENKKINIIKRVYTKHNGTWVKVTNGYISSELINQNRSVYSNPYYVDARKLKIKAGTTYINEKTGLAYTKIFLPFSKPIGEINLSKKVPYNMDDKRTNNKKSINDDTSKYFLGASIGFTHLDATYNKINGSFSPVSSSDENTYNFGWEAGYNINKNSFTTISYNQINLDDAKLYNYLLSYNRRLSNLRYNPYVGILGGVSFIKTTKSPVANMNNTDAKGKATALGIQVGSEYKIQKDFNFFAQYQFIKAKHTTNIVSGTAKASVIRDNISNIMFGIRWSFK